MKSEIDFRTKTLMDSEMKTLADSEIKTPADSWVKTKADSGVNPTPSQDTLKKPEGATGSQNTQGRTEGGAKQVEQKDAIAVEH